MLDCLTLDIKVLLIITFVITFDLNYWMSRVIQTLIDITIN